MLKKTKNYFVIANKKGYSPSYAEIKARVKLASVSTVYFYVSKLKEGGYLKKMENVA